LTGKYWKNTVLHGNTGSVLLLGNFGSGLFDNKVMNAEVKGVYVHYVWMQGEKDQQGPGTHTGILGMQTCLSGTGNIYYDGVTVDGVWVGSLGGGKSQVNRAISMGALDPEVSPLFCAEITAGQPVYDVWIKNLFLTSWKVYEEQQKSSLLFSSSDSKGVQRGFLKVENIWFYDQTCGQTFSCISETAVKIYHEGAPQEPGYFICAMDSNTRNCMNEDGAFWQNNPPQFCEDGPDGSCQNLYIDQVPSATGNLWFPTNDGR